MIFPPPTVWIVILLLSTHGTLQEIAANVLAKLKSQFSLASDTIDNPQKIRL